MESKKTASQSLEEMANSIVNRPDGDIPGVEKILKQDIAMTLEHLSRHRNLHRNHLRRLLNSECYICTELKEVYRRTPIKSLDPLPDRARLRKQLQKVEEERCRLSIAYEEGLQKLHGRLVELTQQWERIAI